MTPSVRSSLPAALCALLLAACARGASAPAPAEVPATPVVAPPVAITDGRSLVEAMHRRYEGKWFRTLQLFQENTSYSASGRESKTQWWERIAVPGRLRIDNVPLANRAGVLYLGDTVRVFDNGAETRRAQSVNLLLLATIDLYAQPPARTAAVLDSLGFALGAVRRDEWQGRPVWVTGAAAGDSTTNQLWVDAERMLVVRLIQKGRAGSREVVSDWRFQKFADVGGGALATETLQYRDGRLALRQEYRQLVADATFVEGAFDPARWGETQIRPPTEVVPTGQLARGAR